MASASPIRWPPCFFTASHGVTPVVGGVTHRRYRVRQHAALSEAEPPPRAWLGLLAFVLAAAAAADGSSRLPMLLPLEGDSRVECARSVEVHLIRHAQGTHNHAEDAAYAAELHNASAESAALFATHGKAWVLLEQVSGREHWDAPLTAEGWRQALRLRHAIQSSHIEFDQIAVSPMRRTIQTAFAALPQFSSGGVRTLHAAKKMASTANITSRAHTREVGMPEFALRGPATVPVVATDLLRERIAHYTCDRRMSVSELKERAFDPVAEGTLPRVDFEHDKVEEEDTMLLEVGAKERDLLVARATRAAQWLLDLPEPTGSCKRGLATRRCSIGVVSHQHLLLAMTSALGQPDRLNAGDGSTEWHRPFYNAERRGYLLCEMSPSLSAALSRPATWLAGIFSYFRM